MGIPSYFRKITSTYPHIVQSVLPFKANTLCFDFNCLIYRCLQSPTLRPFPGYTDPHDADLWEDELLKEVAAAVKEVWTSAGSPSNVFIAVDGVVPMAKIRQQRVRRFKSAWLSQQEGKISWDKNAITPGTAFMDKLTRELEAIVKKHGPKWVLSSVQEPGEGEHKLLAFLRRSPELSGPVVIYGLDADLILLSMIFSEQGEVWLMRERQEFEGGVQGTEAQQYSFLDIAALKEKVHVTSWITCLNYVTLMSLMGNDFLPHSMTHKLSDDGHSCIMKELVSMTESEAWLVSESGSLNLAVLKRIAGNWASEETERMYRMIEKKGKAQRGNAPSNPIEALPLTWNVEKEMLLPQGKRLRDDWRDVYWSWMNENVNKDHVCREYVKGIQWILAYYTGKAVDTEWMFPYWIPPLWGDLARLSSLPLEKAEASVPPTPQEQLSMVLPLQSWGLVRDPRLKTLPLLCPQMWPVSFGFFSAGRKWLWECEARIPTLTAGRIRDLLSETK